MQNHWELKRYIFSRAPFIKKILEGNWDLSLFDYANSNYIQNTSDFPRKEDFLGKIYQYSKYIFGLTGATDIKKTLREQYLASTATHHGPMGHPFFFQSSLTHACIRQGDIIHFCMSQISLGNSSYPRWICLFGKGKFQEKNYERPLLLPFFSAQERSQSMYSHKPFLPENIYSHFLPQLSFFERNGEISSSQKIKIEWFVHDFLLQENIIGQPTYSKQCSILNHLWWKKLFPDTGNYYTIDAEDFISFLLEGFLQEKESIFWRYIFDSEVADQIKGSFNGIPTCFDIWNKKWTYLFWYLDERNIRHALWRGGNEFISEDKTYKIPIEEENILLLLREKKLIPSWLLIYTILHCYYGVDCMGWFSQNVYLEKIRNAYRSINLDIIPLLSYEEGILCEDFNFLFWDYGTPLTALDMESEGISYTNEYILNNIQHITLEESLTYMLPEIAAYL